MSTRLKADLESTMEAWINGHLEDDDWPRALFTKSTAMRMAEAAYAVLMCNAEGQQQAIEEGVLKEE